MAQPKVYEKIINRFDGGMAADTRSTNFAYSALIKNFDAVSYSHKLVPFRSSETGDSSASTFKIQKFVYANSSVLYGLTANSGAGEKIYYRTSDLTSATWNGGLVNVTAAPDGKLFIEYKDILYFSDVTQISSYAYLTSTFTAASLTLSYTNMTQGLVHSANDIMFVGYDNKIAKNNAGSWTATALTLPSNMIVTSLAEYGNYLAIGCKPKYSTGRSKIFLWDMTSTSWNETIDAGEGALNVLEEIEGILISISAFTTPGTAIGSKMVFRYRVGTGMTTFLEFTTPSVAGNAAPTFEGGKQKINNRLYFGAAINLVSTTVHRGVWCVSRMPDGHFSVTLAYLPNNDTAVTTINGFIIIGDIVFISYVTSGTYGMSKTDDQLNWTATSTYQTLLINGGNTQQNNKLLTAGVMTEPLPSGGSVVLGYQANAETSVTKIFTYTTTNGLFHEAINIESTGVTLPQFLELMLQVTCTGGATITGIYAKWQEVPDGLTF